MEQSTELRNSFYLQRTNDLLEQIERLKAIDASGEPQLQIEASLAIKAIYEALARLF